MPYVTVFEITQKPFQWWFSAFGLIFIVIGTVFLLIAIKWPSQERAKRTGLVMVIFASFWSLGTFVWTFSQYRKCMKVYRTGSYNVVEGHVEDFQPMPYEGHQQECFRVQ